MSFVFPNSPSSLSILPERRAEVRGIEMKLNIFDLDPSREESQRAVSAEEGCFVKLVRDKECHRRGTKLEWIAEMR